MPRRFADISRYDGGDSEDQPGNGDDLPLGIGVSKPEHRDIVHYPCPDASVVIEVRNADQSKDDGAQNGQKNPHHSESRVGRRLSELPGGPNPDQQAGPAGVDKFRDTQTPRTPTTRLTVQASITGRILHGFSSQPTVPPSCV
jgi:hypothetical protein